KSLVHENVTNFVQRFYLIADTEADEVGRAAQIDIVVGPRVCSPGDGQCGTDELLVCNDAQNGFASARACAFGCDATTVQCNPPQNAQCKGAVDILARGGTFTGQIQEYENTYTAGLDSCLSPAQ